MLKSQNYTLQSELALVDDSGGSVSQTEGTVKPADIFNPEDDVKQLKKAMKGLGMCTVRKKSLN